MSGWQIHQPQDLSALDAHWRRCEGVGSVFQSFVFARHWAEVFGDSFQFHILWHQDPFFLAPLVFGDGTFTFLGQGLFDYLDVVGSTDPEMQHQAAAYVRKRVGTAAVRVHGVPGNSPYQEFWRALGWRMQSFSHAPRHAPTTGAAFELEHKRHARRWFRAASQQLEIRRAITSAERVETAEWLMQQKESNLRSSGQQNVLGARERDWVCRMAAEETVADAWNLRRQGRRASALLAWHSPFRRYAYTISYEKQEADCSPGVLLLFAVVRETMEEGKEFDFLTGEQPFKTLFATHREPLLCCEGTGHE